MDSFGRYMKAELEVMNQFRIAESARQGRELSRNEAAALWAATRAADYRANYREGEVDGGPSCKEPGNPVA